jgi:hypothetical protein
MTEVEAVFFTTIIGVDTDVGIAFYWIETPSPNPTPAQVRKLARTSKCHGPFNTEAECAANLELVLFGPDAEVVDGEGWPFASGSDAKH